MHIRQIAPRWVFWRSSCDALVCFQSADEGPKAALGFGMVMKPDIIGCAECATYLSLYESATFALARVHQALGAAEQAGDRELTRRLKLEAYDVADRQRNARLVFYRHQETAHGTSQHSRAPNAAASTFRTETLLQGHR